MLHLHNTFIALAICIQCACGMHARYKLVLFNCIALCVMCLACSVPGTLDVRGNTVHYRVVAVVFIFVGLLI